MKDAPKVIRRGSMTYVLYAEKVVVGIGTNQWVSYNQYDNWNRQGITLFKKKIKESKEDQYNNPSDLMSLAYECEIKGAGTQRPKDVEL